jgi:Ulp1 family protease
MLLIPIHDKARLHWYLVIFNLRDAEFQVLDSMLLPKDSYDEVITVGLG